MLRDNRHGSVVLELGVSHLVTTPSPELGHPPVCAARHPLRVTAIMTFIRVSRSTALTNSPDHDVAHDSSRVLRDPQATGFAHHSPARGPWFRHGTGFLR